MSKPLGTRVRFPKQFYRNHILEIVEDLLTEDEDKYCAEFAKFACIMSYILDENMRDDERITYKEFEDKIFNKIVNLENTIEHYLKIIDMQIDNSIKEYSLQIINKIS